MNAFNTAIKEGRLSKDPNASNYAGHYMYMGKSVDGRRDTFKHRDTRQYLWENTEPYDPPMPGSDLSKRWR